MSAEQMNRTECCIVQDDIGMEKRAADSLAAQFKAIGHPVRVQILHILSRYGGQACVCDLEAQFDLAQPTISHHLKILRKAGLIGCTRRGQWYYYQVDSEAMSELTHAVQTLLSPASACATSIDLVRA